MCAIALAGREIGVGFLTSIVWEISANHHRDLARPHATVEAAAGAGANAVKFMAYRAKSLTIQSTAFLVSGARRNWVGWSNFV